MGAAFAQHIAEEDVFQLFRGDPPGISTWAGMETVSPGWAASRAVWAVVTSNSAPICSGMMVSVAAS